MDSSADLGTLDNASAERAQDRQRRQYDRLWAKPRAQTLSADRIRYQVWDGHLEPPILDLGCGDGLLARTYEQLGIVSLDQSATGLAAAPWPKLLGRLESLPVRSQSVETIVASEVMEHAGDPVAALKECRRIARPGAKLLLSVPLLPLSYSEALFHRLRTGVWPSGDNLAAWDPEHERRYSLPELRAQLVATGWQPVREVPLFGSVSTALLYFGEQGVDRVTHRHVNLAHHGARADRWIGRWDRHSGVALIATAA